MEFLDTDIKYLKGVGTAKAKVLAEHLDIHTFRDLLHTFPIRHVDLSRYYRISEFRGEMPTLQILGRFVSFTEEGEGAHKRLVAIFSDSRNLMQVVWFAGLQHVRRNYHPGVTYILMGKPTLYRGTWQMAHPEISPFDQANLPSGFRGVYSVPETMRKRGYTSRLLSTLVSNLTSMPGINSIPDTLPAEIIRECGLMPLGHALLNMHLPSSPEALQHARERMKFEELFYLEMNILRYSRSRNSKVPGYKFLRIGEYFNNFYSNHIPFELTGAQKRVLREIRDDMRYGRQMNRLLQGDVGSGKTMVAFMSLLMAVDNDCQGALMAPTEILATQHYETLSKWGSAIGLRVELLTGSTRAARRREIHAGLIDGSINILVGTHAIIEDNVNFLRLGLAVIDEQHRFGVAQRARMWKKNSVAPHVLVMTATPIPRTLAMTVYGDLEVSVIDELPPGRKPVTTMLRYDDQRAELTRLMRSELAAGRQIYVVYPLITENPKLELRSVEEGYERMCELFPDMKIAMVHGRLKPAEKDYQMELFASGQARILVATTVIEVGVNVPNASVMIIENAERFGLSQLHQLRGRVGRGSDHSYCILVTKQRGSDDTRKRLGIMTETTDGFLISEADMKMRGPGDMEGTQQSGIAFNLKVANLATDGQILTRARDMAMRVLDAHPELGAQSAEPVPDERLVKLSAESVALVRAEIHRRFSKTVDWSRIS